MQRTPLNLIGYLGGTPAGMVSATSPDSEGTVELISMWVAPFARGLGLGDALVAAVIRWASSERAQRVVLCVVDANIHATALYARHGFEEDGFVADASSETGVERRMVRPL